MLLQFTVENFLSFDEETVFSMLASDEIGENEHPSHVIAEQPRLVRGAAIYGANGAGKSNLIAAMEFSRHLILFGVRPGQSIGARPFALRNGTTRPTKFGWIFRYDEQIWNHSIEILGNRVTAESLYARGENQEEENLYFLRSTDENGEIKVEFGAAMVDDGGEERAQFLKFVAQGCRAEQPFFNELWERDVRAVHGPLWWFATELKIVTVNNAWAGQRVSISGSLPGYKSKTDFDPIRVRDESFTEFLSEFLRYADTGIEKVIFEREPLQREMMPNIEDLRFGGDKFFDSSEYEYGKLVLFSKEAKLPFMAERDAEGIWVLTPKAVHLDADGNEQIFPFEWESAGTRRLLYLVPWLFQLFSEPTVLIIDELDQHLHSMLAREFVRLALDDKRAARGQLIFASHDTSLLDKWLLRRDEIWFVGKNQNGASNLFSLSQFDMGDDVDYERSYLHGLFEGKPYFKFSPLVRGWDISGNPRPPSEAELRVQINGTNSVGGKEKVA